MAINNYERYMVREPAAVERPDPGVKNRRYPPRIYMSSDLVPDVRYNVEFGRVWIMPEPNPHIFKHGHRDCDELTLP